MPMPLHLSKNKIVETMNNAKDFEILQNAGDPLEKLICLDVQELSCVLYPYASVWANHIYPRRIGNGSEVDAEWMHFAGCHYTALVRLHHALSARKRILEVCQTAEAVQEGKATKEDYIRLLTAHAECAAFWDNIGASIDNFVHARLEAKTALGSKKEKRKAYPACPKCGLQSDTKEKVAARTLSQSENPNLYYAFERRHQFIHSVLVPHRFEAGMITFNLRHYDDAATDWTKDVEVWQNIDTQINQDWEKVLQEFGDRWSAFHAWLQSEDKQRPSLSLHDSRLSKVVAPLSASKQSVNEGKLESPPAIFPVSGIGFSKRS